MATRAARRSELTRNPGTPAARRLALDAEGIATHVRQFRSPNCDARPDGVDVDLVVIHNISLPPGIFDGDAIIRLFTNRLDPAVHPYFATIAHLRLSSHFLVRRNGELVQFVPCALRAWHAGVSSWRERAQCNDFSIGIELEGTDVLPFAPSQYTTLAKIVKLLQRRYPIAGVVGHSEIAPGRKTDPGPAFDWARLHRLIAPRDARRLRNALPPSPS